MTASKHERQGQHVRVQVAQQKAEERELVDHLDAGSPALRIRQGVIVDDAGGAPPPPEAAGPVSRRRHCRSDP